MTLRARNVFGYGLIMSGLMIPHARATAQQRMIRVVDDEGQAVAYANVTLEGERPKITSEKGEVEIGTAVRASLNVDVRRLGFEPWYGKLAIGDTVMVAKVQLHRLTRRLFTVKITDSSAMVPAYLRGFYQRMLDRQRGIGAGFFITPEDIDKRNINLATSLLQGLNGVSLARTATGKMYAISANGSCMMSVLVDGHRLCPARGCEGTALPGTSSPAPVPTAGLGRRTTRVAAAVPPSDEQYVIIDNAITPNEIAAVEVYPRGAAIPFSLPTPDNSCGTIAIWTGGRKAP